MSVAVSVTGLSKAYLDGERLVEVLRAAELEVAAGEVVAIVGPSGAGKSTLLHLLGALDVPDGGSIRIGNVALEELSPAALAPFRNATIGFVFQFQELLADFTAFENVVLPGRIAGRPLAELAPRAEALLEEVGLTVRAAHYPSELSGGERQRVAFCRALLLEPPLLLADEPTGNLDPESGDRVFALLREMQRRRGTTAVVVTHNPEIAARCARVLRLDGGLLRPM